MSEAAIVAAVRRRIDPKKPHVHKAQQRLARNQPGTFRCVCGKSVRA